MSRPKADEKLVEDLMKVADKHMIRHPEGRVSVVILSLVAVWRTIYKALPKNKRGKTFDGTPGWIAQPPKPSEVYVE